MGVDPITGLLWLTIMKMIVGAVMLGIVALSVYRFKGLVLSVMGMLLLSNVLCLILIAALT